MLHLKTDPQKTKRMVTFVKAYPGGTIEYGLAQGMEMTFHNEIEVTKGRTKKKIGFNGNSRPQ